MNELDEIRALCDDTVDAQARERALLALRAAIEASGSVPREPRRRRRRRGFAFAALAVATAVAAVLTLVSGLDGPRLAPAPAAARAALERAATIAEQLPEERLGPGDYFYVRDRSEYLATYGVTPPFSSMTPTERETWTNRDGTGRFDQREIGRSRFPGPDDRAGWIAAGRPALSGGHAFDERFSQQTFSGLTYAQLRELPSDGQAMFERLVELGGSGRPANYPFTIVGDLLRSAPVPPRVRAALYRAAAYIPGVRYAGEVRDKLGRAGLAIELRDDGAGQRRRIIFDPATAAVLAEEDILVKRVPWVDADPGFVAGYRLVVEQGIVRSDTARPRGTTGPRSRQPRAAPRSPRDGRARRSPSRRADGERSRSSRSRS